MNAGEACKLLRDHTISEYFITPDEVMHIIIEVNCKVLVVTFSYINDFSGRMSLFNIPRSRTAINPSSCSYIPKIFL